VRIAIIGAGGYTFPLRLIRDVLAFESTQDATFRSPTSTQLGWSAPGAWRSN